MSHLPTTLILLALITVTSCSVKRENVEDDRMPIIFDTDANNELDDQHAMAYLLFNSNLFNVKGVTVNTTHSGGNIDSQYKEAERILHLTKAHKAIPLFKGADKSFTAIRADLHKTNFDGAEAVDFIIEESKKERKQKLVVLAVGKLTNIALAIEKDPSIQDNIRLVWLGSNYPDPGEYNQDNDTVAMNYLLNQRVPFEIVTVRWGKSGGTAEVTATKAEIEQIMPGLGPRIDKPVEGRHGGKFSTFGDYSVDLFKHIHYSDSTQSRALFDMVAVAILKNPEWGKQQELPAPILVDNQWVDRPANSRKVILWEDFDKEKIMTDFYSVMRNPELIRSH